MKIACTYSNKHENGKKRWIDEMLNDGFSYMEIAVSKLPEDEKEQDEIISYALSRGLTLNLHAPYGINNISSSDRERRALSISNVKHSIDLAEKHGLGTVTFHPGRLSNDAEDSNENWERMLDIVAELAQYAKENQVFLGIENMECRPYELVYTIDDLNRFAHLTESNPYLGVCIDFAHYSSHGIGMPDLRALRLPIYDIHLSQNVNGKMHCSLSTAEGSLEVAEVCRMLLDYGYDGLVVLEVTGDAMCASKEALEKVLATLTP